MGAGTVIVIIILILLILAGIGIGLYFILRKKKETPVTELTPATGNGGGGNGDSPEGNFSISSVADSNVKLVFDDTTFKGIGTTAKNLPCSYYSWKTGSYEKFDNLLINNAPQNIPGDAPFLIAQAISNPNDPTSSDGFEFQLRPTVNGELFEWSYNSTNKTWCTVLGQTRNLGCIFRNPDNSILVKPLNPNVPVDVNFQWDNAAVITPPNCIAT